MGRCALNILYTFLFACWFSFCERCIADQDGSRWTSQRCDCHSVEFWLPKRKNNASKLLSFETNRPSYELLLTESYKRLRLLLPKHCELSLDKPKSLQENGRFRRQNIADWSVEVLLDDELLESCLTIILKCKKRTLCVGIDTGKRDSFQSTQRKLLMFRADNSENAFAYQPYGVLLSVLFFCSMITLLALCGKAERNSQENVARDSSDDVVKMVSSEKVKNAPKRPAVEETDKNNHEAKPETIEIKVEGSKDRATDRNSNNATQRFVDDDIGKDVGKTSVDGAVFGKEKMKHNGMRSGEDNELDERKNEREDFRHEGGAELDRKKGNSLGKIEVHEGSKGKRKDSKEEMHEKRKEKEEKRKEKEREKEVKNKERSKEMRSKRSRTVPTERPEPIALPKTSLSVKTHSSTLPEERKPTKKERKRSKKGDNNSSVATQPPFPGSANRHSFINRELPKRPSEEVDTDDGDYESITLMFPKLTVPSANTRASANVDNDVYDSVDDVKVSKCKNEESDMYEIVDRKLSKPGENNDNPPAQLYESVTGQYEEPRIQKQRSFSDIVPSPSTARTDAERKTMSLHREKRENAPTPPPLAHLKIAAQSHHNDADETEAQQMDEKPPKEIDPYTVTFKKGDLIIQEVNITDEIRLPKAGHEEKRPLSPHEIEELYTKVDKEKQKKDRQQAEKEKTKDDGIDGEVQKDEIDGEVQTDEIDGEVQTDEIDGEVQTDGIEGEVQTNGTGAVSTAVEEHQYETMPDKKDLLHKTEEAFYEEVVTKK